MRRLAVLFRTAALAAALTLAFAACSTTPAPKAEAVVIDVRTPEEFAQGHLEAALNIDLQSGTFEQQLATLSPDASYIVYCRSGNRSAQAAALMKSAGFPHVQDAGPLQSAATTTGRQIVSGNA